MKMSVVIYLRMIDDGNQSVEIDVELRHAITFWCNPLSLVLALGFSFNVTFQTVMCWVSISEIDIWRLSVAGHA
jgi:hypothetical protein